MNKEFEVKYQEQKKKMLEKYDENIKSFSRNNEVDLFVAWDMLKWNAKCLAEGDMGQIITGGGKVNIAELVGDYNELAKYIVMQE